jgi:exopolyphosphatase/guanosine-5'-triphosphate,3'-diphosphate pyrophosphatase
VPLLASIDVGSNTVRLLAAMVVDGRITREVLNLRDITRLGEGLRPGGRLRPEAKDRTMAVLKGYAARLDALGVKGVSVIGTEALRTARDAQSFVAEVQDKTGLSVEVISGEEEARRTLLGIKAGVCDRAGDGLKLLVDIGGGSTELTLTRDWVSHKSISLPLGAVSLYERFLLNDPPRSADIVELEGHCFKSLIPLRDMLPAGEDVTPIGTAGTVTTLAAVDLAMEEYDPVKVTGHRMGREVVARLLARFAGLPKESRKLLAGLEHGREDIILSGTALLGAIMDVAGAGYIVVCDYGLREGNLLDYSKKRR